MINGVGYPHERLIPLRNKVASDEVDLLLV